MHTATITALIALASTLTVPAVVGAQAAGTASHPKKTATPAATKTAAPVGAPSRFTVAATGNEARYRVREQLVGVNLPGDAVGVTHDIAGAVLVDAGGALVADSSHITVTLTGLKSDRERRDGFLQRRTLETDRFPTVELVLRSFRGLSGKLPPTTPAEFELLSDLTVHGVTRPTLWKVTARSEGADVVGTATTAFTFKDVGLDQPRVPVVLSVADTIKLEYDFRFSPAKAP